MSRPDVIKCKISLASVNTNFTRLKLVIYKQIQNYCFLLFIIEIWHHFSMSKKLGNEVYTQMNCLLTFFHNFKGSVREK